MSHPTNGEVWIYEHVNYGGKVWKFAADNANFCAVSGLNDVASSAKVGPNTKATLFEHVNYGGKSVNLDKDTPDFRAFGWNDIASSVKVETTAPKTGEVWLYEHINYGGRVWKFNHNDNNFCATSALNDIISSARVGPYTRATLFEHVNYGGKSVNIETDTPDFRTFGWNDIASSLKIETIGPAYGEVWIYEHINYGGRVWKFNKDDANFCTTSGLNDIASSAKVGAGTNAQLFEHVNFGGKSVNLQHQVPDFRAFGWNDVASSVKIQKI